MPILIDSNSAINTRNQIGVIADGIKGEYPFYTKELKKISTILFSSYAKGMLSLNIEAFGELFISIGEDSHLLGGE